MKSLILILAFFSASAFAQNSDWLPIANNKDKTVFVEGKKGSFTSFEKGGQIITRMKKNNKVDFNIVYMLRKDCANGFGKIYYFDTSDTFLYSSDYVENGGNLSQAEGDTVCRLLKKENAV